MYSPTFTATAAPPMPKVPGLPDSRIGGNQQKFYGFESWFVLGQGHNKDVRNARGPCSHGTQHEVGTTEHN